MKFQFNQIFVRTLLLALVTVTVAGCATAPMPLSQETASRIHKIGVISFTAKTFTRQYTGLTVFGNEKEDKDISDWKVDEQYETQIAYEAEKTLGLSVVKAPYSSDEFSHVNDLNGPWEAPAYWGPNWDAIANATKTYCSANSLDAILVLAKSMTYDFLAGTNQYFGGAGIYVRGPGNGVSVLHLISKLALLDCTTTKPIAIRTVASNQNDMPGAIVQSAPLSPLPSEISRRPISEWTEEQKQHLQAELVALPTQTWGATLKSMFPVKN